MFVFYNYIHDSWRLTHTLPLLLLDIIIAQVHIWSNTTQLCHRLTFVKLIFIWFKKQAYTSKYFKEHATHWVQSGVLCSSSSLFGWCHMFFKVDKNERWSLKRSLDFTSRTHLKSKQSSLILHYLKYIHDPQFTINLLSIKTSLMYYSNIICYFWYSFLFVNEFH